MPFKVGETLTYDVSWSSYLTAGGVTLRVQDKHPSYNSMAYYVIAEARPTALVSTLYTLYYKADALIDVYNLLPQRASVYSEEGKRHQMKVTMFDQRAKKATFENVTAKTPRREFSVPSYAQDALSSIYVLRALPVKAGAHTPIPFTTGGRVFKADVVAEGIEPIKTPAGTFSSWRFRATTFDDRGQPQGKPALLWISDTPDRIPVRLQSDLTVGSFNLIVSHIALGH